MRLVLASILFLGCSSLAFADVESGPKAGDKVAPLKVHAVSGPIEDKEVDFAKDRKDEPTIYAFINGEKFARPVARYLKELDGKVGDSGKKAVLVVVWTGGEFDKNKEYMPKLYKAMGFGNSSLAVFNGDANGPKDWGLNSVATVTAVVVNGGKVVKSFAYESVNDTDAKEALESLKKATEKK
jgi:hypothetical protein